MGQGFPKWDKVSSSGKGFPQGEQTFSKWDRVSLSGTESPLVGQDFPQWDRVSSIRKGFFPSGKGSSNGTEFQNVTYSTNRTEKLLKNVYDIQELQNSLKNHRNIFTSLRDIPKLLNLLENV